MPDVLKRKAILTDRAPQPIGPYSQAIEAGGFLFCSGQIALDPDTGIVQGEDAQAQTRQIMENIHAVLMKAGYGWDSVVKTTIFLTSMDDFPKVNEIYSQYFRGFAPPARSTVQVSRLPKDVRVEIEVVALAS